MSLELNVSIRNANAMSRLPLPEKPEETPLPVELVLLLENLADLPVTAKQIRQWTRRDPLHAQVLQYIKHGWPNQSDPELKPFWSRQTELTLLDGCMHPLGF